MLQKIKEVLKIILKAFAPAELKEKWGEVIRETLFKIILTTIFVLVAHYGSRDIIHLIEKIGVIYILLEWTLGFCYLSTRFSWHSLRGASKEVCRRCEIQLQGKSLELIPIALQLLYLSFVIPRFFS
ncbi:hypothetical protein [Helicobacter felis]|uniref:hypothetical protein n=1 Tax=Helicobacter felis TaxID=214 RepID=UPI000CEDACD1|nr:hypothetical protein [Helicobacter felis]